MLSLQKNPSKKNGGTLHIVYRFLIKTATVWGRKADKNGRKTEENQGIKSAKKGIAAIISNEGKDIAATTYGKDFASFFTVILY